LTFMTDIEIRPAHASEVAAVVALLADDVLGAARESPDDLEPYQAAFARLEADPNQELIVAVRDGTVVATLQLSILVGLSHRGGTRSIIEAVRVHSGERGNGLGTTLIEWAIAESARRGCNVVQLTSAHSRTDAHRFYERLGFVNTHVGFKLDL
jgi:GNAT superfamily N-acetyltransferase